MQFGHLAGERAAHRHPVQEFDALGAGVLDKGRNGETRDLLRIAGQAVQTIVVELLVDEARARPIELMRQTASAEYHDL